LKDCLLRKLKANLLLKYITKLYLLILTRFVESTPTLLQWFPLFLREEKKWVWEYWSLVSFSFSSPLISASYCFALQRLFFRHTPTWCWTKLDKVELTWDQVLNNRSSFQKNKKKFFCFIERLGQFYVFGFFC